MNGYLGSMLGMFLTGIVIATASPVAAREETSAARVSPPATCRAHPAGLAAGDYPWDAPACASARADWEAAQARHDESASASRVFVAEGAALRKLLVPAGTAVPVHVVGSISSGSAKPDDVFQIQAADDVVVNDMIVIRKGAGGQGHIVESDSAGGNGHSGAIALAFDFINAADGGRVRLSQATQKQAEEDRKGASSTATIIGFATFGIGGLFGHNLAHGRQKTIDEKTVTSAFVADNVHVETSETAVSPHYDK